MSLSCLASFHFFIFPFWYKSLCKVTEKKVYNLLKHFIGPAKHHQSAPVRHMVLSDIPSGTPSISQKPTQHCSGVQSSDGSCVAPGSLTERSHTISGISESSKCLCVALHTSFKTNISTCETRKRRQKFSQ